MVQLLFRVHLPSMALLCGDAMVIVLCNQLLQLVIRFHMVLKSDFGSLFAGPDTTPNQI